MAMAIPIIMIAGAAMSAVSAAQQGKAAKAVGDYNASINMQNAQITREQTIQNVRQFDREQYLRIGAIRQAQGASGGKAEGSVLDILADTAAQGEIERQDIVYRGALAERGFNNAAKLDRFEGATGQARGNMQAGQELLKGVGSAYGANQRLSRT
jgi:hypothetical protein